MTHKSPLICTGVVETGSGVAAGFTSVPAVRDACIAALGIDPWPGTLNLRVNGAAGDALINANAGCAVTLGGERGNGCDAVCIAVQIDTGDGELPMPGALIRPQLAHYPADKLELLASLNLRDTLNVSDGDSVTITPTPALDVDAVVFDLDGTLVNSLDAYHEVARVAAKSKGKTISREFVKGTLDANNHAFWELVFTEDEDDRDANIDAVKSIARDHWPAIQREFVTELAGIDRMLKRLSESGLALGIVTAGSGSTITPLERSGSHDLFGCMITRKDVSQPKPDPQGLELALERLGVRPERALYVGDSRVDVQTAHAAGAQAIAVLTGAGSAASLAGVRPSRVLASLDELPTLLGVSA